MDTIALVLGPLSLAAYAVCAGALLRHLYRAPSSKDRRANDGGAPASPYPGISLLKPIKGDEEALAKNLASFFEQSYPGPLEIVFVSEDSDDPGIRTARSVAKRFPQIPVRFCRAAPAFGMNPKVANLAGAVRTAQYDLVLQTDANVRATPDFVERLVRDYRRTGASLLGSLVAGDGEENLWAAFENLQLNAVVGAAMGAADRLMGVTCVVGKAMMFRRSELLELSGRGSAFAPAQRGRNSALRARGGRYWGLEIVRNILCEDFVLGRHYHACGRHVVLSPVRVVNVNKHISLRRFMSRHARWLKMRAVIHRGSFCADLACNPIFWALCSLLFHQGSPLSLLLFASVAAVKIAIEALLTLHMRGTLPRVHHLLLLPLKDLLIAGAWFHAAVSRTVIWRGERLYFGRYSRIYARNSATAVRRRLSVSRGT